MTGPQHSAHSSNGVDSSDERARAAARRAFIRTRHPDAGGDPDTFAAGLAEFDRDHDGPSSGSPRPSVYRSRRPDRVVSLAVRRLRRRLAGKPPRNLQ